MQIFWEVGISYFEPVAQVQFKLVRLVNGLVEFFNFFFDIYI